MAHFQMSTGGSKSNEHVDHFLVDIHISGLAAARCCQLLSAMVPPFQVMGQISAFFCVFQRVMTLLPKRFLLFKIVVIYKTTGPKVRAKNACCFRSGYARYRYPLIRFMIHLRTYVLIVSHVILFSFPLPLLPPLPFSPFSLPSFLLLLPPPPRLPFPFFFPSLPIF